MMPSFPHLSSREKQARGSLLIALFLALVLLYFVRPESGSHWLPFASSCGAVTGLPCIFCGTTRAIHHLLHGDVARALYYNWLSFPLVTGALCLIATMGGELLFARNLLARLPRLPLNRRNLGVLAAALVSLWIVQVYLAVSQRKTELLNPRGLLYSLVVSYSR